jgi:hypothetical protein
MPSKMFSRASIDIKKYELEFIQIALSTPQYIEQSQSIRALHLETTGATHWTAL